jgi:hypothetical protein
VVRPTRVPAGRLPLAGRTPQPRRTDRAHRDRARLCRRGRRGGLVRHRPPAPGTRQCRPRRRPHRPAPRPPAGHPSSGPAGPSDWPSPPPTSPSRFSPAVPAATGRTCCWPRSRGSSGARSCY